MPIIISKHGRKAARIEKQSFAQETDLQKYISENPEAIPLDEIKENANLLILDREFPTNVGPIDILAIDSDGEIYILETKLYKNPDKRQVLAQVLDYGAALWSQYSDPDDFVKRVDSRLAEKSRPGLIQLMETEFGTSSGILDGIHASIVSGSYRFVVLMDQVYSPLKDLILYINQNSQFTIYAVELEYYLHDGYQIMIPHLFGAESRRKTASEVVRGRWDEISFFEEVENRLDPTGQAGVRDLYEFSKRNFDQISWGTGKFTGSFSPKLINLSQKSMFTIYTDGNLSFNFAWFDQTQELLEFRDRYRRSINEIEPIHKTLVESTTKFPSVPVAVWGPEFEHITRKIAHLIEPYQKSKGD